MPDYSKRTTIIQSAAINYTPAESGWISVLSDGSSPTNVTIFVDGSSIGNAFNSTIFPVKAGQVVTSNVAVRLAHFFPFS